MNALSFALLMTGVLLNAGEQLRVNGRVKAVADAAREAGLEF